MVSSRKRILIVDDEPNLLLSLEFLMAQNGYHVHVARSGEEALESIPEFRPHLLLLDVALPYRSGFEICHIVRHRKEWHPIRIVLLSAKGRDIEKAKGLALGADSYITKPFSTKDLLRTIGELLTAPP